MASGRLLLPGWMPALDSDGAPIPNARVYFYDNGTDDLASVYSDDALTVPLSNPVYANSSGRFPAIWASDAITYSASVDAPYGPAGIPFTFDNLSVSIGADILIAGAAEAAANEALQSAEDSEQALADIIAFAADAPDAPSILNKANVDGSNVTGANAVAFRTAIGALSEASARLLNRPIRTVIPLGTSITQGDNNGSATLPALGGGSLTVNGCYLAGLHVIENAGIAGDTLYQCQARLPAVLALQPDMVLLECWTNSITAGLSQANMILLLNAYEQMILDSLDAGVLPFIVVPPAKDAAPAEVAWVRYFLYRMASYYGIGLADLYLVTNNPATGTFRSGLGPDGVHPAGDGLVVCANEIRDAILDLRSHNGYTYYAAYDGTTPGLNSQLLRNGCFSRAASPPTPDGWIINQTNATATLVGVTPSYAQRWATGNTYRYDKTVAGLVGAAQGNAGSGFAVGDVLDIAGRIKLSGLTNGSGSGCTIQGSFTGAGGLIRPIFQQKCNGEYLFETQGTVPSGATAMGIGVFANDVSLIELNAFTITNRTANEAVWRPGQQ